MFERRARRLEPIGRSCDEHAAASDTTPIAGRRSPADPRRGRDPPRAGLDGHSDADVLTHALIDALLGAAGLGDIGSTSPTATSATGTPIARAARDGRHDGGRGGLRARERRLHGHDGGAQARPVRQAIREPGATLGLAGARVNVKASTGEGIGFVGRGEGVAALAVASLRVAAARVARDARDPPPRHPHAASCSALEPRDPGRVGIYACGPTVYSRIHIGNARPFVVFSLLKRFLEHEGYAVTLVVNVTDVNDKIYAAAARRVGERGAGRGDDRALPRRHRRASGSGAPTTSRWPPRRWRRSSTTSRR